jgi:hypothetical protein
MCVGRRDTNIHLSCYRYTFSEAWRSARDGWLRRRLTMRRSTSRDSEMQRRTLNATSCGYRAFAGLTSGSWLRGRIEVRVGGRLARYSFAHISHCRLRLLTSPTSLQLFSVSISHHEKLQCIVIPSSFRLNASSLFSSSRSARKR